MLRKILDKFFITNKYTQCKTSRTLKTDVFQIPDNNNIRKLFSKCELFSWIKLITVPIHLKYWYYNSPRPSLPSSPSLSSFTLAKWNSSSAQSSSCFPSVCLFCPTLFDHVPTEVLDIPNHMPIQANQI